MATKPSSTPSTTNKPATSSVPTTLMSDPSPACSASLTSRVTGKLSHVGINIAMFDFGCSTLDATLMVAAMHHFANDDGFNTFCPPVVWQFFTNDVITSVINQMNFAKYDDLVQLSLIVRDCNGTGIGNGMGNNGYAPAVPAHTSDLDAHYWRNMFIELGFGDTIERNSSTNPSNIILSNISTSTNMNINSISSAINNSKTRRGVSRSATVTVMKHLSLPLADAYAIVRSRRLSVLIQSNVRLLYILCGWEIKLAKECAGGDERKLKKEVSNVRLLYILCRWEIKLAKECVGGDEHKLKKEV
ncbi:hypothetical protein CVT25_008040, partial [Psilocybe cyanescens]